MLDDKTKKKPQDSSRISLEEPHEIIYWKDKFGCTEEKLRIAVDEIGDSAKKVEEYLKNH